MTNDLNAKQTKRSGNAKRCPFCGELIIGSNRKLLNDFGALGVETVGCTRCITRPLSELKVPDGFVDFHKDPRAKEALEHYRRAIERAERAHGRL